MSPVRRHAITWTNAGLLSKGLLGTSFSEIWIWILSFSFKKMHLKMSSARMAAILSRGRGVNSSDAEAGMFRANYRYHGCWWIPWLTPCVARLSAATISTMYEKSVIVFFGITKFMTHPSTAGSEIVYKFTKKLSDCQGRWNFLVDDDIDWIINCKQQQQSESVIYIYIYTYK